MAKKDIYCFLSATLLISILVSVSPLKLKSQGILNVDFSFSPDSSLSSIPIQFTDLASGGVPPYTYEWCFGNGDTSSVASPVYSYNTSICAFQQFQVSLKVYDQNMSVDSISHTLTVRGEPTPVLIDTDPFTPFSNCDNNPSLSNPNFTINLLNGTPDSTAISFYLIDWGDGSPVQTLSNSSFPISYTYTGLGLFNLSFSAVSQMNCTSSVVYPVANQGNPAIGISSQGNTTGCSPQTFQFVLGQYQHNSPGTYYVWDFGDGSPTVTWNYNDPITNDTITHTYTTSSCTNSGHTFTVSVTAYNECDFTTASVGNIRIYSPPVADFTIPSDTVCINSPVSFQNNTISGFGYNCMAFATYYWDFGDTASANNSSTLTNPVYTYTQPGNYSITLTAANSICGTSQVSRSIVVLDPPQALISSDTAFGCVPFSINTYNNTYGEALSFHWQSTPSAGVVYTVSSSDSTPTINFNQSGHYTLILTADNLCGSSSDSLFIDAGDAPQLSISSVSDSCGSMTLAPVYNLNNNSSAITSYNWSFPGGTPSASSSINPLVNYSTPGLFSFMLSVANQCGVDSSAQSFNVFPIPVVSASAVTNSICAGDSTQLSASGASSYFWTPQSGLSSQTGVSISASPSVNTSYMVAGTSVHGCISHDTVIINVNQLPSPTILLSSSNICDGDSVILSATGGMNYHWSGPDLIDTTGQQTTAIPSFTSTYTLTASDSNGCSQSTQSAINVEQIPQIQLTANTSIICAGDSILINLSGASTYQWQPAVGINNPSGSSVYASPSLSTNYTITGSTANACTDSISFYLHVNPQPIISLQASQTSICAGNSTVLSASGAQNYQWSPSASLNSSSGAVVTAQPLTPQTYTVTASDFNGCQAIDSIYIQVSQAVNIQISPSAASICQNDSIVISALGASSYVWSGPSISSGSGSSITAFPQITSSYTVTGTDTNGCSNQAAFTINVHPTPLIVATAAPQAICAGDSLILSATGAVNYQWSPPAGLTASSGQQITAVPATSTNYLVTGTDANGCSAVVSVSVTVNPLPSISISASQTSVCHGDTLSLTASGAAQYQWLGPCLLGNTGNIVMANPLQSTVYTVFGTDANNCSANAQISVNVNSLPVVTISPSSAAICRNDTALLTASGAALYSWTPSSGLCNTSSPLVNASPITTTFYHLTATDTNGCIVQTGVNVSVHPNPNVQFTHDSIVCRNTAVTFTNYSTSATQFLWSFGDGNHSTLHNPLHTYQNTGFYNLTLISTNTNGCSDSSSSIIQVVDVPQNIFTISGDSGCSPFQVQFNNLSSGYMPSFFWQFGNGSNSAQKFPSQQSYLQGQGQDTTYQICHTVSNLCGSVSQCSSVKVMPRPQAIFGLSPSVGCSPMAVNFANSSQGNPSSYIWDMGNGNSLNTLNPPTTYYTAGANDSIYTIMLTAMNACGSDTTSKTIRVKPQSVTAFFTPSVLSGCAPLQVNFNNYSTLTNSIHWGFGDGNFSSSYSPVHTYTQPGTYNVSLIVGDTCSSDTSYTIIVVHPSPVIDFSMSADSICLNESVQITNYSQNLSTSLWTFGDGNSSTLTNVSHQYSSSGLHTITLTGSVQNSGCIDSTSKTIFVKPTPVAAFSTSSPDGCAPYALSFTNGSIDANYYSWSFGDGNGSVQSEPNHTYLNAGNFFIEMIAVNSNGCADTTYGGFTAYAAPQSSFSMNISSACSYPAGPALNNTSIGAQAYEWDFGNGQTSTLTNPQIVYNAAGTYDILMIAYNQYNCSDSSTQQFIIHNPPQAGFSILNHRGCQPLDVVFSATSTAHYISYLWNFGDGSTASGSPVTHKYSSSGTFDASLVVIDASGCTDTLIYRDTIIVHPIPVPDFSYINTNIPMANSGNIQFNNLSSFADTYFWDFGDGNLSQDTDPLHGYVYDGLYYVSLTAYNSYGCMAKSEKAIEVDLIKGLFIPNAFSPDNHSSSVRMLKPAGQGLREYHFAIYDSWGSLVWETREIDENGHPAEGWDGLSGGRAMPQGVYVWKVSAVFKDNSIWSGSDTGNGDTRPYGTLMLIR